MADYVRRPSWQTGYRDGLTFYRGHVAVDWRGMFSHSEERCEHEHETREDAVQCARELLARRDRDA